MEGAAEAVPPPLDQRTRNRLRGFAFRLTGDLDFAEDAAQEAVLRVLAEDSPRDLPYLFRIVLNIVRSEARRFARRRLAPGMPVEQVADPDAPDPLQDLLVRERNEGLWTALGSLPDRERTALLLRFAEDLSCADIARALGISPNAVSCLLHRGKERMRALLPPRSQP